MRAAITWQDRRIGGGGWGLLPKIAWLADNDLDAAAEARWLLASWDALGLWLTGEAAQTLQGHETAMAARDLEAAGVRRAQTGDPLPFGTPLGALRADAASALGIRPGIPVVAGVNDGTASMLGAGLLAAGDAVDTGGTSGGIGIYSDREVAVPGLFAAPAPLPGRWVVGGAMAATGAVGRLAAGPCSAATGPARSCSRPPRPCPRARRGSSSCPYLAGERAPVFDDGARGRLRGPHAPARARAPRPGGPRGRRVRDAPRRRAARRRRRPDPRAPARRPRQPRRHVGADQGRRARRARRDPGRSADSAVLGAAILAAAGTGLVADLEAGVTAMTAVDRRIEPDPAVRARYDELFEVYRSLYPALAPTMHALGSGGG